MSKLHPYNSNLWQRPKKAENVPEALWYDSVAVGKNTLGNIMQKLSEEAKLSKPYTNHCIRATCITNLDDNDIETRHIMGLSGHKSESAIRSYTKRLSEKKKLSDVRYFDQLY
jgi:site-specific recombinase XerD